MAEGFALVGRVEEVVGAQLVGVLHQAALGSEELHCGAVETELGRHGVEHQRVGLALSHQHHLASLLRAAIALHLHSKPRGTTVFLPLHSRVFR
jgi:hypothetical protein